MILGLAIHTPLAIAAALFYLFQDMLVKANLFMSAGAVRRLAGGGVFAGAGGVWRAAPWTSLLFLIPALSLAGVPPFSGFWAKLLLLQASLDAERRLARVRGPRHRLSHAVRHGAGSGRRSSGRATPRATAPAPAGCPPR